MAKDLSYLSTRAQKLAWTWVVFWIIGTGLVFSTPFILDSKEWSAVVGIGLLLIPAILIVLFLWSLGVIARSTKAAEVRPAAYLLASIFFAPIGIPISLGILSKKTKSIPSSTTKKAVKGSEVEDDEESEGDENKEDESEKKKPKKRKSKKGKKPKDKFDTIVSSKKRGRRGKKM